MDRLISQGMNSFSQGDHARMHALWSGTTVFNHLDNEAIASLFTGIQATAESGQGSEWSWLMLCLVYLDSSDQFTEDRSAALRQVGEWAQRALAISPGNAYGHRYLGSAHYWLDEPEHALAAYRKSHALQPQVDLQARIFEMEHAVPWRSIFSYPDLADGPAAPDYYTAGVTVGKWKRPDTDAAALQEIERLQTTLYERCLERFASAGTPASGQEAAPAALDIHTYAMCCNNLGVLYNAQEQYEQAAAAACTAHAPRCASTCWPAATGSRTICRRSHAMFCSRSVGTHLLRGAAAMALLLAAMLLDGLPLLPRLAAFGGALLLMRGCPACWLVGLFQTWQQEAGKDHGAGR